MSREDVEVVRGIYERWGRRENASELLDPEIEWSTPHPDASSIHGRDGVVEFLREYGRTWQEYSIELEEIRDLGEGRVLARFRESMRGSGSGAVAGLHAEGVWTIRDGKAIKFEAHSGRDARS
jgi:ketosteroid isomerase-like protein